MDALGADAEDEPDPRREAALDELLVLRLDVVDLILQCDVAGNGRGHLAEAGEHADATAHPVCDAERAEAVDGFSRRRDGDAHSDHASANHGS